MTSWLTCIITITVISTGCSATKKIPAEDHLYSGVKWSIDSSVLDKNVRADLEKIVRPKPNARFLGMPYKLYWYNFMPEPKKQKGLMYRMKYKWGEAPVLLSQVRPTAMEKSLEGHLFDHGYFKPGLSHEIIYKGREASVRYHINAGPRYVIREIYYPEDSSAVSQRIRETAAKSLVKKGDYLNLETLEKERAGIDDNLKRQGYFFFIPDFILYKVDTLHDGKADVYFTIKEEAPKRALETWKIGKISVYGNYTLQKDSIITSQKGKKEKYFSVVDKQEHYRTSVYENALLLREGQLYRKPLHSLSIERFMNLNTFRFVKFVFLPDSAEQSRLLDTRIYITPLKKRTVRLETSVSGKTGNYLGSELNLKWRNVNLFKGAEILDVKIGAGFDLQVGGNNSQSANAYTLQAEANFNIPRIIPHFKVATGRNSFLPRTGINIGGEYLQRPELYTQRTFRVALEYIWKYKRTTEHTFRPIRFQSIDPSNTTPKFDSILAEDISLRASFEKQLILGTQYQFFYHNTFSDWKKFTQAFRFNVGSSGNLFSLISHPAVDTPGAKKMFNLPVSQFVKLEADLRGYLRVSPHWTWANRIIAGTSIAYGNSLAVPYAEQFFIGGSSSVRAFRIRTLGPGSYHSDNSEFQANESGDIKFEMNSEMRYSTGKYLRLAAFIDAGNIWLRREPPDKPGSGLTGNDFFNEMAVGAGLGLRLDFSILLLRFDLSIPLRKPWYPEGKRWVLNEIDFGSSAWRKENLILSIGIGYPF